MKQLTILSFRLCELCRTGGEILQIKTNCVFCHSWQQLGTRNLDFFRARSRISSLQYRMAAVIIGFAIIVSLPTQSFAANNSLPDVMFGSTKLMQSGKTYFGGVTGNYAVLNNSSSPDFGFRNDQKCVKSDGTLVIQSITSPKCFVLSSSNSAVNLLTSRSYVRIGTNDEQAIYELPALYFSKSTIAGDVFGNIDYTKFSFWGNSTSTSGDSAWTTSGYTINPKSQSSWLDSSGSGTTAYNSYYAKIRAMADNGKILTIADTTYLNNNNNIDIYLQRFNLADSASVDEAKLNPEGKTWIVDSTSYASGVSDLAIGKATTGTRKIIYHGVGTILVKGNVDVAANVEIVPATDKDKLGIISIAGD